MLKRDKTYYSFIHNKRWAYIVLFVTVFACLGLLTILASKATTPTISIEMENSTVQNPAVIVSDATSSGNKAVRFSGTTTQVSTDASWNSHVSCTATVTTIATLLGTQQSSQGGATFAGGAFTPGSPNKSSTVPPCNVSGHTIFVELKNVMYTDGSVVGDGDFAGNVTDPSAPASTPANFKNIHCEVNRYWGTATFTPYGGGPKQTGNGWVPTNPPVNKRIDLQGFVFWDTYHTTEAFHHYSGWELHTVSAWRLAQ